MNRLPAILFAYAIGVGMLAADRFALINPDGISYISIAQHWAAGRFADAVNAYWSPLFSWTMLPWLIAGVPPLAASKISLWIAGGCAIAAFWQLVRRVTAHDVIAIATTVLLALLVVEWSFSVVTPDLVAVAIFLWYLVQLDRLHTTGHLRDAIVCGLIGALMYLNKAIGLPLFLAHFTLSMLRPSTVRHWLTGIASGMAGATPWIAAMAWKYGGFTIGTAGTHNWRLMGPTVNRFEPFWSGLFAPPNASAISVWEDPSSLALPAWSALDQPAHLVTLAERHGRVLLSTLWARSPYVPIVAIVIAALIVLIRLRRDPRAGMITDALIAIGLVAVAALPFVVEERYIWIIPALTLLLAAFVIDWLQSAWPKIVPTAIAALAVSIVAPSFRELEAQPQQAAGMRRYSESAAALPPELRGTRMAMNPFSIQAGGAPWTTWNDGLYLSWYAGLRFYGTVGTPADLHDIDTFMLVGSQPVPDYLAGFHEVAALPLVNARVFSRSLRVP